MTSTPDILDLIDAAIEDFSVGPDAVRCNAEPKTAMSARPGGETFGERLGQLGEQLNAMGARLAQLLGPGSAAAAAAMASFTVQETGTYHFASGRQPHRDCIEEYWHGHTPVFAIFDEIREMSSGADLATSGEPLEAPWGHR
jgi:hypothetical protein